MGLSTYPRLVKASLEANVPVGVMTLVFQKYRLFPLFLEVIHSPWLLRVSKLQRELEFYPELGIQLEVPEG